MAHFSKIDENNIVKEVLAVSNNVATDEQTGINFLIKLTGWPTWKQTSYNTIGGQHKLGGTPFRKNYGTQGFTYDEDKDAFIPPKPYNSWILNETSCLWEAPSEKPDAEKDYIWNEDTTSWQELE
tara:strand:+ start:968 stop:1342 length:375 start_codon:yes stop_codon:yes gene_type:complete